MDLTYFGHSTFQIESGGTTILVDPFFEDNPHTDVAPDDLDPDVILITHAHFDHFADAPSIATRTGALVISNFEIVSRLGNEHAHENVHPLNTGGKAEFEWGSVEAVNALHSSSFPDGDYGGTANGHVIHIGGTCIYNAGDTAPFAEMAWIGEEHDVDLAVLPVGDAATMGFKGALRTAKMVTPSLTIPVHYGTFPFLNEDPGAFSELMAEAGFEVRVMNSGDTATL